MAQISGNSQIPNLTIGGRVFTDLSTNLIVLYARSTAANPYGTARQANASAGYQVPVGKTLTILAVKYTSDATGATSIQVGYGDNDVGNSSAAAPTNFVQNAGAGAGMALANVTAGAPTYEYPCFFQVPASKYPAILQGLTTGVAQFYGYLT